MFQEFPHEYIEPESLPKVAKQGGKLESGQARGKLESSLSIIFLYLWWDKDESLYSIGSVQYSW